MDDVPLHQKSGNGRRNAIRWGKCFCCLAEPDFCCKTAGTRNEAIGFSQASEKQHRTLTLAHSDAGSIPVIDTKRSIAVGANVGYENFKLREA